MSVSTGRLDRAARDSAALGIHPAGGSNPGLRLTSRRLRQLGRPFRSSLLLTGLLGLAVAATRIAQALLIARILGHVLRGHGPVAPSLIEVTAVTAVRLPLVWWLEHRAATTADRVSDTLRSRLYSHLAALGPGYLVRRRSGAIETVMVDGVDRLGSYLGEFVPLALAGVVTVVGALVWVAVLDPLTALAMLAAALLVPAAPILTARAFGETGRSFSEGLGRMASEYLDAIQGMLTLKAFDATTRWGHRLAAECEELSADATSLAGIANMHVGFVSLGMAAGTVLGVALATLRATHHALAGSALLAILLLARECFRPLAELQAAFPAAYQAVAGANGVFELLHAQPDVAEPSTPTVIDRTAAVPSIEFDRVSFGYRSDHPPVLQEVGFSVAPGETVALVGPSGAGKSTVVSLLLRFFDPQSGSVRVGGHDIRELARSDLRSMVAVTFQDTYLLHRSVRDNLLIARPDATQADIEAATRAANAHDFIIRFADGYATVVGERGGRLSGGERQRIAIARALLADTPILILDEPTSSVDSVSETLITRAVESLTAGRTTIVIAHRLSTVQRADRVVVLDAGRVVETGRPDQLRTKAGLFALLLVAHERSS